MARHSEGWGALATRWSPAQASGREMRFCIRFAYDGPKPMALARHVHMDNGGVSDPLGCVHALF